MHRLTIAFVVLSCLGASAQPGPTFEVVAIKPVPRPMPGEPFRVPFEIIGSRVQINAHSSIMVLSRAVSVALRQIDYRAVALNVNEFYDIQATLPSGATRAQVPEMLKTMLAERFKLAYHREIREYPVTVITVGKSGMKLRPLPDGTPESSAVSTLGDGTRRYTSTGTVASLFPVMNSFGGIAQTMDETKLDGVYTRVRDQLPPAPGIDFQARTRESFEAMIETAGLKLEARNVPLETIVVDRVEKTPTEN